MGSRAAALIPPTVFNAFSMRGHTKPVEARMSDFEMRLRKYEVDLEALK